MYKGSCLCGAVSFEIDDGIEDIVMCHCSRCRKAQGSAYATNGMVDAAAFRLQGEEHLTAYRTLTGSKKYFCSVCGSPILSRSDARPDKVRVRLGSIESDIDERPIAHIFASSRANWECIADDLPQYDGYVPED